MTMWDFIYFIGCCLSLIMACFGLGNTYRELPEEDKCLGGLVFSCIICSLLSWAVPIWWVGFEVYNKLRSK